ncbi:MAG TPA: MarR family winged helix-turn-helix transcriptional regulator, partial [Ilumatobacteraceae bacterium]
EIWRPLAGFVEQRWIDRFGTGAVLGLRTALTSIVDQLELELPRYLPIISPTQNGMLPAAARRSAPWTSAGTDDLSTLLSRALHAFTLDFETQSRISLPISANTLRVVTAEGVRVRDLPALTGVSKEAHSMATGFLARHDCVAVEPAPSGRGQMIRLTPKGQRAQDKYRRVLRATNEAWRSRFGDERIAGLSDALTAVVGSGVAGGSPLLAAITPHADGWRATRRPPTMLPHHPMVLHRGGFPDGS